jgi:2-C-methyl-D-erythritol 4-phosphate cytidylyltransferase
VIPAAGTGSRMGGNRPKQFLELDGKPILFRTIEQFQSSSIVDCIVLVVGEDDIETVKALTQRHEKVRDVIRGGAQRQDSVWNGLQKLKDRSDSLVIVHDAVRPFVSQESLRMVAIAALKHGAAVAGVLPKETIKFSDPEGFVLSTPDRKTLRVIQTPQAFRFDILHRAYEQAFKDGFYGTDDASLVERLGIKVKVVDGDYDNIKITTPADLELAKIILKRWNSFNTPLHSK